MVNWLCIAYGEKVGYLLTGKGEDGEVEEGEGEGGEEDVGLLYWAYD